jgi:hypothetical protein
MPRAARVSMNTINSVIRTKVRNILLTSKKGECRCTTPLSLSIMKLPRIKHRNLFVLAD